MSRTEYYRHSSARDYAGKNRYGLVGTRIASLRAPEGPKEAGSILRQYYWYSSARDYSGRKGLIDIELIL